MMILSLVAIAPWFDISGGLALRDSAQGISYGLDGGLQSDVNSFIIGASIGYHRFSLDYQEDTLAGPAGGGFQPGLAQLHQSCDAMNLSLSPGWKKGSFQLEGFLGISLHLSNRSFDQEGKIIHAYPDRAVGLLGLALIWRGDNMGLGLNGNLHTGKAQDAFKTLGLFVRFYPGAHNTESNSTNPEE